MSDQNQVEKARQEALARLAIRQAVARASDGLFEDAQGPAEKLQAAGLDTGQIRNLENIAYSTDRLSDIYDFLKKQMGRPGKLGQQWRHEGVGQELLETLTGLRKQARKIVQSVEKELQEDLPEGVHEDTERQVHLMLCQEYLKHVAAHYQYAGAVP